LLATSGAQHRDDGVARDSEVDPRSTSGSAPPAATREQGPATRTRIEHIHAFLEECPTDDPAYAQIRQDFVLRRDGALVPAVVPCTPPMSLMPVSTELQVLQALRWHCQVDARGVPTHAVCQRRLRCRLP
jgi:hypothetical protein